MAILYDNGTSNSGDTSNLSSYATPAFTIAANSIVFVKVYNTKLTAPDTPTVSGGGLTFTQVATLVGANNNRLTVFRAVNTGGSVSVTPTASFAGVAQTGCIIDAISFTGTTLTGTNGSNAVVQSNTATSGAGATSVTVTLSAFGSTNNATLMWGGWPRNQIGTGDGGSWVVSFAEAYGSPAAGALTQYLLANDTSITASTGLADVHIGIALELQAAAAPTATTQAASSITTTTATGNGNITADNGRTITERGVVWSTSANPTTSDSKATAAGTTGAYTASMASLTPNTLYHYRAYAINSIGTSYGADTTFTTDSAGGANSGFFNFL